MAETKLKVLRLAPVDIRKHSTGWLSPEGKFYSCRYSEHYYVARRLYYKINGRSAAYCAAYDSWLEDHGWRKLQDGRWWYHHGEVLTQPQFDAMFRWCKAHNEKMPVWATTGDRTVHDK